MRVVAGRDFERSDLEGGAPVIVVNQALSKALWPGESPLDKCLIIQTKSDPCRRVVGVVSDAHQGRLMDETSLHFYLLWGQVGKDRLPTELPNLLLRVNPDRRSTLIPLIQHELRAQGGGAMFVRVQDYQAIVAALFRPWRMGAAVFSAFGLLALVVAAVGVYSVIAYMVGLRLHEMGVRIALGAQAADVLRLVLGELFKLVVIGIVLGVALAVALSRLVASLLYGISARDPLTLSVAAFVLLGVGLLASFLPARRAAKVDPVEALRSE